MIAGTGKIDITPDRPIWMDGMIRAHESEGVHDPIYARALYLSPDESQSNGFIVFSVDVCTLKSETTADVRKRIQAATGVPEDRVIIAATHNHSGPATFGLQTPMEAEYVDELSEKLVSVAQDAVNAARPAAIGCASGEETTISHYRRSLADDGHVVMNWEPWPEDRIVRVLGEIDPEVGVVKVVSASDPNEVICLLYNHAGHPNVLSGDNYLISADYPGYASKLLEEEFGGIAMFVNGAQGTMDIDGLRDRDWEGVIRVGSALARAVSETASRIAPSAAANVRLAKMEYDIPLREVTDAEWAWAEKILAETGGRIEPAADGVGDDYKAVHLKSLRDATDKRIHMQQIGIAVDDTALISFPGELFTEIGVEIKSKSPFERTWIIGLANGYSGYFPTVEAIGQGGYEVDTRHADSSAETTIIERSIALLNSIKS